MSRELDLDDLLLHLFDVTSASHWSEWLEDARRFFGATSAALSPLGLPSAGWMGGATAGVASDRLEQYRDHYFRIDTWTQRLRNARPGEPQSLSALVPDRELLASEIYNDFMRPGGRRFALGITVDAGDGRFVLHFGRTTRQGEFDEHYHAALGRIAQFLPKALVTQRALQMAVASTEASTALLNQSNRGFILLDSSLKVVFANRIAAENIASEEFLGVRQGRLTSTHRIDERKFREALDHAQAFPGSQTILTLRTRSDGEITVSIAGLAASAGPTLNLGVERPAVVVTTTDRTRQTELAPEQLVALFGFTLQEARTASYLVSGLDLHEVANRLSISRETVRYHLKGLFAKTSAHSQRELVHFITNALPPNLSVTELRATG